MLWEMIAMVSAGFCFAGVALTLRKIRKKTPKWIVPAAAGLGMLCFQIYSEYTWFKHTAGLLPEKTTVIAEVPEAVFYRPWTYVWPQVLKFVAADLGSVEKVGESGNLRQVRLYFFERRMGAQHVAVLVDCDQGVQALAAGKREWGKTAYTENLLAAVCR